MYIGKPMDSSRNFSIFIQKIFIFRFSWIFEVRLKKLSNLLLSKSKTKLSCSNLFVASCSTTLSAAWVFMAVDHFSGVMNFIKWNRTLCTGKHPDECSVDDAGNDKISLCCSVCNLKQWIFSFKCTLQAYKICFQIASASTKWRYDQWNRERFLHK